MGLTRIYSTVLQSPTHWTLPHTDPASILTHKYKWIFNQKLRYRRSLLLHNIISIQAGRHILMCDTHSAEISLHTMAYNIHHVGHDIQFEMVQFNARNEPRNFAYNLGKCCLILNKMALNTQQIYHDVIEKTSRCFSALIIWSFSSQEDSSTLYHPLDKLFNARIDSIIVYYLRSMYYSVYWRYITHTLLIFISPFCLHSTCWFILNFIFALNVIFIYNFYLQSLYTIFITISLSIPYLTSTPRGSINMTCNKNNLKLLIYIISNLFLTLHLCDYLSYNIFIHLCDYLSDNVLLSDVIMISLPCIIDILSLIYDVHLYWLNNILAIDSCVTNLIPTLQSVSGDAIPKKK
eukprot:32883_1